TPHGPLVAIPAPSRQHHDPLRQGTAHWPADARHSPRGSAPLLHSLARNSLVATDTRRYRPLLMQQGRRFLGGLSAEAFVQQYWQKQPLLVRGALPDYVSPVEPEELAGLACEEEVESRVVVFDGATWHLENGPFEPHTFPERGERNWTLLVQDLEEHLPRVGALLDVLDFLP